MTLSADVVLVFNVEDVLVELVALLACADADRWADAGQGNQAPCSKQLIRCRFIKS